MQQVIRLEPFELPLKFGSIRLQEEELQPKAFRVDPSLRILLAQNLSHTTTYWTADILETGHRIVERSLVGRS